MNNENAEKQEESVHQDQPGAEHGEVKKEMAMKEENTEAGDASQKEEAQEPTNAGGEQKATEELKSEEDLKDHHDHELQDHEEHGVEHVEEHKEEQVDYAQLSKEEMVELMKELAKSDDVVKSDHISKELKPFFSELLKKEKEEALQKFIAEGGEADNFEYRNSELDDRFEANLRLIKDRRSNLYKEKEKQKEDNLTKKEGLLERLREYIDSDENNVSFNKFKELQEEWKAIGPVAHAHARTLWANYNALVNRFYDNRSIYFELKELDRKKNLTGKLELCAKAEALNAEENIKEAVKQLNELHHDFKHMGPVPQDKQEEVWNRFKAASDAIYEKRKEFVSGLKHQLEENHAKKVVLADKAKVYIEFTSDKIKEWNVKTKEILALQTEWEAIGGLPKEKAKEVNKNFWGHFKTFFKHKSAFFKQLDKQREENLSLKQELVDQAKEWMESEEWDNASNQLKKLQARWKEIGPVPEKVRDSIYKEFKGACDSFFNGRRDSQKQAESAYGDNLKKKEAICDKIESFASESEKHLDEFYALLEEISNVGFVPKADIGTIRDRQAKAVDSFINGLTGFNEEEKQQVRLEAQINKYKNDPNADQKIYRKEQAIRRQIQKIENDIALWNNNMEFFASSKQASKVIDEFEGKIKDAQSKLVSLKDQLKMLRKI